VFICELIFSSL